MSHADRPLHLFLTGTGVTALAAPGFAELAAKRHALAYQQLSARTARLDLSALDAHQRAAAISAIKADAHLMRMDCAILPHHLHWRDFGLLASDMDSTIITIECIDEIADFCGKKAEVAAITEASMRGDIQNFTESLKQRVALLKGTPASALDAVYHQRLRLSEGAEALLARARQEGLETLLVSGGFTFFTDRLVARLGFDRSAANVLEIVDETLTGAVLGPIVDGAAKLAALLNECERLKIAPARAIAIGDGANDLPMLSAAGLSVAFHAKPRVAAKALVAIEFGGLDVLDEWLSC